MSFGKQLKQLRKQYNFTQEEMSNKLAMEQSTYSKYENDKIIPNIEIVKRVANEFNVSPEWLMQSDNNTVTFEHGSTNNGNGLVQTEYYYAIPKDLWTHF